jgi:Uncharacterized protein, possibly involved in aromatic compounds catabolism
MNINPRFNYPPPVAKTLGFDLVEADDRKATIEMVTDVEKHANPMGTVHGGVLCDLADAAIGTAHATGLNEGESFTSTVSRYVCDILNSRGKLVAQVTSTVMTLRGKNASGR